MENLNQAFEECIVYFKELAENEIICTLDKVLPFLKYNNFPMYVNVVIDATDSIYKQILFEVCLAEYYKIEPYETMYKYAMDTEKRTIDEGVKKAYERANDKLKKHHKEAYKRLGLTQEDIKELHETSSKKRLIYKHQKIQKEIMESISYFFYKLAEGKFSKNHNYPDEKAENDLLKINDAYQIIFGHNELNNFEKCIQFFQLEDAFKIETMYKFFKAANEIKRPVKELKKDIDILKNLFGDTNGILNTANHTITGIDVFVEIYKVYPNNLKDIIEFNCEINRVRHEIVSDYKTKYSLKYDILSFVSCSYAEEFFKNYIGMGQHIVKNKQPYKDINMKYFRRVYSLKR